MVSVARALAVFVVLLGVPLSVVPVTGALATDGSQIGATSVAASDEDSYADACAAAQALIATNPERAVQLVVDIRAGTGNPTAAPSTAARPKACESVLNAVVASQALADPQLDDDAYCDVLDALREADAEDQADRLADLRGVPFTCDDETAAWVESVQAGPPLDASDTGDAWDEFVTNTLEPLAGISAFLLASWAALIVLARLLVFFPFRNRKTSRRMRVFLATTGLIAIVVAPVSFAVGATRDPVSPVGIGVGVVIGFAGAALTGWWIGAIPRLTVEVSGEKKHGVDSGLIAAVLRDMGGQAGRGIEIPVGPDLADLSTSVSEVSKNEWIALAQRILILITNVKPWRVQVEVVSDRTVSVVIGRNGRQLAARRIDAKLGRKSDDAVEAGCTDAQRLAAFISGVIIATMRDRYERDFSPGLHGATKPDAIALQYIASCWYRRPSDRTAALELLLRARLSDPAAQLAVVTYQYYKYRLETTEEKTREYLIWLDREVCRLAALDDKHDQLSGDLAARLTITYAAILRNWTAACAAAEISPEKRQDLLDHPGSYFPVERDPDAPSPTKLIEQRMDATKATGRPKAKDVDARQRHDRLKIDWYLVDPDKDVSHLVFAGDGTADETGDNVLELGDSPDVVYDLGCALARFSPTDPKVEVHIRYAFDDPENVDWARSGDPELLLIRELEWFKELTKKAEPELGVPPFRGNAAKLDVLSLEELAAYEWKPSSPLDATLVGRLRSSARLSLAAERADGRTRPSRRLGPEARTVLVRHMHERRVPPHALDAAQVVALQTRIREVGYLGTTRELKAWLRKLCRAANASVPAPNPEGASAPVAPGT